MEIHNTTEDFVIAEVNAICDALTSDESQGNLCTCSQCRLDAACYVLNRSEPRYIVSHRGAARVKTESDHQTRADLTTLAYEGIRKVNHNQRPYFDHKQAQTINPVDGPAFYIPAIKGQVYNGLNFSPVSGIQVELLQNKKLVPMKDNNWQNPYILIPDTGGVFTFWPKAVLAEEIEVHRIFEFSIRIAAADYDEQTHGFSIPVVSKLTSPSFSLSRTFKLPDIYLFPPGEEKNQLIITG